MATPTGQPPPTNEQLKVLEDAWGRVAEGTVFSAENNKEWIGVHRTIGYMRPHIMATHYPTVGQGAGQFIFYGHLNSKARNKDPFVRATQRAVYIHEESGEKYVLSASTINTVKGAKTKAELEPFATYGPIDKDGNYIELTWHFETTETNTDRVWLKGGPQQILWRGNKKTPPITTATPFEADQAYWNRNPFKDSAGLGIHDHTLPDLTSSLLAGEERLAQTRTSLKRTELLWYRLENIKASDLKADLNTAKIAEIHKEIKTTIKAYTRAEVRYARIWCMRHFLQAASV